MIDIINCNIDKLILHKVGSKYESENIQFSRSILNIENPETRISLLRYFTAPFKSNEYYNFFHSSELTMNEVYVYISKVFENPNSFYEQSINITKHLYEQSSHPKIKGGEFYMAYMKNCILDNKEVDVIGLFKSENKDTFLKVSSSKDGFNIESLQGININKLDKGCLIFNIEKENGFVVSIVDNVNRGVEARYWIEDFLHIHPRQDEYYDTQNILSIYKNFIKKEIPQQFELSKVDQADLINKSIKFFKEKTDFDINEFAHEVIGKKEIINSFNNFVADYKQEHELDISNNFSISDSAVKKGTKALRSIIKLDNNFDIYIHGGSNLIEQGRDEKGKYYKVYYREEL